MRILIATDSHLGQTVPTCNANWYRVRDFAARCDASLTLHLGDITRDAWRAPDEIAFAAHLMRHWPTEIRFLPGNHDVGDNPPAGNGPRAAPYAEPFSDRQLELFRTHFGADHWLGETGSGWILIGLNAQLFGTATDEEAGQWAFLEHAVERAAGKPVAIFSHKPLYQDDIEAEPPSIRYVPSEQRRRLRGLLAQMNTKLFLSGHTHQSRSTEIAGTRHVWVPSCAYSFTDEIQAPVGRKLVGVALLDLMDDGAYRFDLALPDGLEPFVRSRAGISV